MFEKTRTRERDRLGARRPQIVHLEQHLKILLQPAHFDRQLCVTGCPPQLHNHPNPRTIAVVDTCGINDQLSWLLAGKFLDVLLPNPADRMRVHPAHQPQCQHAVVERTLRRDRSCCFKRTHKFFVVFKLETDSRTTLCSFRQTRWLVRSCSGSKGRHGSELFISEEARFQ